MTPTTNTRRVAAFLYEYMDGGSLHDLTRRIGRVEDNAIVARILHSSLSGLHYLLENNYVNPGRACLHAGNILLSSRGEVKLSDVLDFSNLSSIKPGFGGQWGKKQQHCDR